jgi:hypothetical protein
MVAWREDETPRLNETIIDFPTLSVEDWMAQGHEPLTPAQAAKRLGVSLSTFRRQLIAARPAHGAETLHFVGEFRGQQFTAWRVLDGRRLRWQVFLLGRQPQAVQGHELRIAELRSRMATRPEPERKRRWWHFGR